MPGQNRRDYREPEKANIIVRGNDFKGNPFEKPSETKDISAVGIAFYLNTSVSPQSFLSIDISQSKHFGYRGKVSALVVRIEPSTSERKLVAAEFI